MKGRRVYNSENYSFGRMEPGDYGRGPDGDWWLMAPNGCRGKISLDTHQVIEDDETYITVGPSLVFMAQEGATFADVEGWGVMHIDGPGEGWHGWLERGIWREA